jgi:hypothetical protein
MLKNYKRERWRLPKIWYRIRGLKKVRPNSVKESPKIMAIFITEINSVKYELPKIR